MEVRDVGFAAYKFRHREALQYMVSNRVNGFKCFFWNSSASSVCEEWKREVQR